MSEFAVDGSFYSAALDSLSVVAESPLALTGLIVLTLAATFLFWKHATYTSLAKTLELVPENDRLAQIREHYGVRPKNGVSATAWLRSRRQGFLFWAYLSTLLVLFLGFVVVFGRVSARPGGVHRKALLASFPSFYARLEHYELAAKNLSDAFAYSGAAAIDPDEETDHILTIKVHEYNEIYHDLRLHREAYAEEVVRWLDDTPSLARDVEGIFDYALNDVHQGGLLQLNEIAYARSKEVAVFKKEHPEQASSPTLDAMRSRGTVEIQSVVRKVGPLLEVLARKLEQLKSRITDNA